MKAIKLFTVGPRFNHTLFVKACHRMNIKAYACADKSGVVFDKEAFDKVHPVSLLPTYLYIMRKDTDNKMLTRPAYADEVANLLRFG